MKSEPFERFRHANAPDTAATAATDCDGAIGRLSPRRTSLYPSPAPPSRHTGTSLRTRPIGIFIALASLSLQTQVILAEAAGGERPPEPAAPPAIAASERVLLSGDVPTVAFPDVQAKADQIWRHISARLQLGTNHPAPSIHFHKFRAPDLLLVRFASAP